MDNALLDIIEEIIEMLEDEKYDSYVYDNNKFHIIDRYNNIDFEAKLGSNSYYFKDNISGLSYIKTKKFLNDKTTIQQILIQLENEKCFYSCLERKGYVSLARVIRVEGEDSLVCGNLNILNHTWKEILEYADERFEDIDNMDKIKVIELTPEDSEEVQLLADMEDEEIEKEFGYTEDEELEIDDDFDEENDDYEYEMNQIDENAQCDLFDIFEKNTIKDYETYIYNKEKSEQNGKAYDQKNDNLPIGGYSETIEEYYSNYILRINNHEIDGQAKCRIIADCEAAVDEKCYESILFDSAVENLKVVLDSLNKQKTAEKNNDLEK